MKRVVLVLLALVPACGDGSVIGTRYRAERGLWRSNREFKQLAIRPQLVERSTWLSLVNRYEQLVVAHENIPLASDTSSSQGRAARDIRLTMARALVGAAQVHGIVGDSLAMMARYAKVRAEFGDLPLVVAEVALVVGRIAESRGEWAEAVEAYQTVLEGVEPRPKEPGAPGAVLELPLRIARLRMRDLIPTQEAAAKPEAQPPPRMADSLQALVRGFCAEAQRHYVTWIAAHPGTQIELQARLFLADVHGAVGEWQEALQQLARVESQAAAMKEPAVDLGELRLARARLQLQAVHPDSSRTTLLSLLQDYPQSPAAPRALLTLADLDAKRGAVDDALTHLERLRRDFASAEQVLADGMLLEGRILEKEGRWREAHGVFRELPVQHPSSEAALQAPLEIVQHYARVEDEKEKDAALTRAERDYRDFLSRFPSSPSTVSARTKLVQTLYLQERFDEAIQELLISNQQLRGNPRGASFLLEAARLAYRNLGDAGRAAEILEQLGTAYPNMAVGRWASNEAARLREGGAE